MKVVRDQGLGVRGKQGVRSQELGIRGNTVLSPYLLQIATVWSNLEKRGIAQAIPKLLTPNFPASMTLKSLRLANWEVCPCYLPALAPSYYLLTTNQKGE
ncbi:MAG: hypothetical protein QMC80_08770 [Thermoplasmatales archaeon]|nr:hypothetical protein [Thermoplasmatales archaeon]